MICPICEAEDYIQYVFTLSVENDIVGYDNPSDEHFLYRCNNNHVYTEDGQLKSDYDENNN